MTFKERAGVNVTTLPFLNAAGKKFGGVFHDLLNY